MRSSHLLTILFVALLPFAGCAEDDPTEPEITTTHSEQQRQLAPSATDAQMAELSEGNNAFAVEMYQQLAATDGNLFYSPFSISLALSMTWSGAAGDTAAEMADVLHFTLAEDTHHETFNKLDLELESRGQNAEGADDEPFRLKVANALWGQDGYPFEVPFLDVLAVNYGAGMNLLDFAGDPDPSRITINDWVADQTEDRITDLLPEGSITDMTRLVLTNAIYFNAAWSSKFDEDFTSSADFAAPGGTVSVDMMRQTELFPYYRGSNFAAVSMPYDGGELDMVVLLPDAGAFEAFEAAFDVAVINETVDGLISADVNINLPKFRIEGDSINLNDQLGAMGMELAFSPGLADFSRMLSPTVDQLSIGAVIHKAFVDVSEAGTEAAAATAVVMVGNSAVDPPPVSFHADRPFIFFIRDIETNAILFVGRVADPTA